MINLESGKDVDWCNKCLENTPNDEDGDCEICGLSRPHFVIDEPYVLRGGEI